MLECAECGFVAKSKGGLGSHRRTHQTVAGPVLEAVAGQLPSDAPVGMRALALRLASAVDGSDSIRDLPALSRELRAVLGECGVGDAEVAVVDDLAARRAARRSDATGSVGSTPRR